MAQHRRRHLHLAHPGDRQRDRARTRGRPVLAAVLRGLPAARASGSTRVKPDVAVMVYNDHGLNFFLDKMPTFAIGAAAEYRNADEGWGLPTVRAVSPATRSSRGTSSSR